MSEDIEKMIRQMIIEEWLKKNPGKTKKDFYALDRYWRSVGRYDWYRR